MEIHFISFLPVHMMTGGYDWKKLSIFLFVLLLFYSLEYFFLMAKAFPVSDMYLDLLLKSPWPKGGINLTHSGGCSFVPLREASFCCCSLWFSVPKTKRLCCVSPPANHSPSVVSETLVHSPFPQGSTASMCYDTSPPLACQQPLRVILGRPDSAELKTSLSQLLWSENNP